MAIVSDLTPEQREKKEEKERKYYAEEAAKAREAQLELARIQAAQSDMWPALKSMAFSPCYLFGMFAVMVLALFRRPIPQVLVDFLNS